jgi:GT2 family glycosyltransferase
MEEIRSEMRWSLDGAGTKDILVVVRDQYEYIRNCLDSLFKNTKEFRLHIWDNASGEKTKKYLEEVAAKPNVNLVRREKNEGFIVPNNRLAEMGSSEWVILLNSDTELLPNWDEVLIGTLKNNPGILQTGFGGGVLDNSCKLSAKGVGLGVDYISGYCVCMHRSTVERTGLFDETNLKFAYCEDSDLSLRIRESGGEVYACHSEEMVRHYGNKTSMEVLKEDPGLISCAKDNLIYLKKRWTPFIRLYGRLGKE